MSESAHSKVARCAHCGRPVRETLHTRTSYSVDYYSMHTGETEPGVIVSEDGRETHYRKLLHSTEIRTCVDCYGKPDVQMERERLFRPERVNGHTAANLPAVGSGGILR